MKIGAYDKFKYNASDYSYFYLKAGGMPPAQMREEYNRLYHVAYQRLERLEKNKQTGNATYIYAKETLIPQSQLTDEELPSALNDMYRFLSNPLSTIKGLNEYKTKQVEEFQSQGFKYITKKNFDQFIDFLEYAKEKGYSKIRVSTRIVELFNEVSKRAMDVNDVKADFDFWLSNIDTLKETRKHRNPMKRRVEEYKREVKRIRKKRIEAIHREIERIKKGKK